MKRFLTLIVAISVIAISFVGCADDNTTSTSVPSTPPPVVEVASSSAPETPPEPPRNIDRRAEDIYTAFPELTPVNFDSPALLEITDDMGMQYVDRMTILCDSPMYWLKPYEMLSGRFNTTQILTGPEGTMTLAYQSTYEVLDLTDNVQKPIRDAVKEKQPDILMITVGINGVSFMDEDYFIAEYSSLVDDLKTLSPDSTVILQSVLPISPQYQYWGVITNNLITEANSWILGVAEEYDCYYLDTFSTIIDVDGYAKDELMMNDGLHLNRDGLTLVLEYIRTHAVPGTEPPPPLPPTPDTTQSSQA